MSQAVGLIRRGFHEVPHMMYGGTLFLLSVGYLIIGTRRHMKYDKDRRIWKRRYTVVREERFDPNMQVHPIDRKYPIF